MIFNIICLVLGIGGIIFGVWCYHETWKWSSICKNVRITVAFKNKVKMDAPMKEWILWTNLLDKDKDSTGRVVYSMGGTRIAILKRYYGNWTWRKALVTMYRKKSTPPPATKTGRYDVKDQTPQNRKVNR